jgi:hypothetical protein
METTTQVIFDIESGVFDAELTQLKAAVDKRMSDLRRTKSMDDFGLGDKVRFNELCGTRYLVGATAQVVGRKQKKIVVKLDAPTGRFLRYDAAGNEVSPDITVPVAIVDLV